MSTTPTDRASFWMACASSSVRFGRRSSSVNSFPDAMLTPLNFATKMVSGPSWRMPSRSDSSKPRIIAVMPTTAVIPMTMPSTVSPERSLFARSVSSAMTTTSLRSPYRIKGPSCFFTHSFPTECFDWIEPRGARRRIRAEEQTDTCCDPDAERHRPQLEPGRQRRDAADQLRDEEPERDSDDAAEGRERDRLGEHLRHDVGPAGAERLSQTDFARPLAHDHQHDVHDHDAANEQRQRHDADEHGENPVGRLTVEAEQRVRGEQAEVVRFLRLQPSRDAKRHDRVVFRLVDERRVARLHEQRQVLAHAVELLVRAERNDRKLVLRASQERAAALAHADDPEVDAFDADDLVERIALAEQAVGRLPAQERHGPVSLDLHGAHHPSALGVERREVDVVARYSLNRGAVERDVLVGNGAAPLRLGHDRRHERAEAPDRVRLVRRDPRVAAHPIEI